MPKDITVKAYEFDELSDEAKEKAREWFREGNMSYDWWDGVYEMWNEKLEKLGFMKPKIWFSGFSSQGDGACFDCEFIDILKWIDSHPNGNEFQKLRKLIEDGELTASITKTYWAGHYCHWNTRQLSIDFDPGPDDSPTVKDIEREMENHRFTLCQAIYRDLENEYEFLNSDEQVDEGIRANEYLFTEKGSRSAVL